MIEKIVLKKSAVLDKMPTAGQLDFGEIALNYHAEHPFLSFKNSEGDIMPLGDYDEDIQDLWDNKLDVSYYNEFTSGITQNATDIALLKKNSATKAELIVDKKDLQQEISDTKNDLDAAIAERLKITDFNTFKADNTKTINVLDRNVSQNRNEIQQVNGIVQNHTTAITKNTDAIATKADKTELDTLNTSIANVYTKAESDARYGRKNQHLTVCGQKQRLISIDRPFDSVLFRAYECGGYLWVGEYTGGGAQIARVARIDLNTEEVKILSTPNNARINRQDKYCITQDEEGNFYWGPSTTSTKIYKCDADLNVIQSIPAGNYDGGWYFGGFLWNYSSNVLKRMDLSGATLKTFEIGTISNNLIMQKIYGTQHGLFAGKFVWDNETDEIYTLEKSVSLSDTHLGGVTLGGWMVPELVTGYDASTHTFTSEPSVNKSSTLGITNYTGRVDEKCVVGNRNCRDIAISFSKGKYVNTINQPLPVPIGTPYYAMDGWMIWSENDKLKILNLLGEWK